MEKEEKKVEAEEVLQSPEKLNPLSLTLSLGPPNLSSSSDFPTRTNPNSTPFPNPRSPSIASIPNHQSASTDFHSGDLDRSDRNDNDETDDDDLVQPKKKRNTVWTLELHNKFIEAVAHIGIRDAVPKNIMTRMNVDGLSRESVASHLQKYRKYLRRKADSAGNSSTDGQFATIPLPFGLGPGPAPPGYNVASSLPLMSQNVVQLQQQQYYRSRQIVGNVGELNPGFLGIAPPNVDEKGDEGCGESKELPPFPTDKD